MDAGIRRFVRDRAAEQADSFSPAPRAMAGTLCFSRTVYQGLTPRGCSTVEVLVLNDARRLELKQELLSLGELI